ncbi:enhancer of mRNA decapping [Saitoella coloradoensis]
MAAQFIGLTVQLSLRDDTVIQGIVTNVDPVTQLLSLRDVVFLNSGYRAPSYNVDGLSIRDLEVLPTKPKIAAPLQQVPVVPAPLPVVKPQPVKKQEFQDPAIVSFGRPPTIAAQVPVPTPPVSSPAPKIGFGSSSTVISSPASASRRPNKPLHSVVINAAVDTPTLATLTLHDDSNVDTDSGRTPYKKKKLPRREFLARRNHTATTAEEEGWHTEDIDQDFDFQLALGKFDKKKVFDEIRETDMTDPESLLVAHNRVGPRKSPAPLRKVRSPANGGPVPVPQGNYHHRDMVLKGGNHRDDWGSSTEEDTSDDDGRVSRRKPRTASRSMVDRRRSIGRASVSKSAAPSPVNETPEGKNRLRTVSDRTVVPAVSPMQMIEAEKLAAAEFGLSDDLLAENAGRSVAMMVMSALGGKRINAKNHNAMPVIVILAGNNKTGACALAAGRQLSNHSVRVLATVVGTEREEDYVDCIRAQIRAFLGAGGRLVYPADLEMTAESLAFPAELILDGIFGYQYSMMDIWDDDMRQRSEEIITWANNHKANIVSLDMPSGISGATGVIADGGVHVQSKWVVCLGVPKQGLMTALQTNKGGIDWTGLFVADIGIGRRVWRKLGNKAFAGWGAEWVTPLEFS